MPRDVGTGIYHYPDGTLGNPGQTIFSTRYNTFLNDLTNTLNQALPVNMGGTGGTSAATARDNLDAEVAAKQVTNYDTHVFEAGSFFSNPGATGEPVAGKYTSGICHFVSASGIILEASVYDGANPIVIGQYTRIKWATWGSWINKTATSGTPASLTLNKTTNGSYAAVNGQYNGLNRWSVQVGNGALESTADVGSDFAIYRCNDAGTINPTASLTILRNTGNVWMNGPLLVGNASLGRVYLDGITATKLIHWDGTNIGINGAPLVTTHSIFPGGTINLVAPNSGFILSATTPPAINAAVKATVKSGFAAIVTRPDSDTGQWHHAFENAAGVVVGNITTSATNTAYVTTSDERLKEDLKSFDAGNIVDDTNVYDFAWKTTGERSYGIVAQQAVNIYPAAVTYTADQDWWGIDYSKYVPVILQELKALRARVAELEGRLEAGATPA